MNKYRASVATAALGVISLSYGQSMGRNSFSSSMIASALSKFHGVKAPATPPAPKIVATAAKVEVPAKQETPAVVLLVPVPQKAQPVLLKPTVAAEKPVIAAKAPQAKNAKKALEPHKFTDAEVARMVDHVANLLGSPNANRDAVLVEMPAPEEASIDLSDGQVGTRNLRWRYVTEGYFDLGYEKLIGEFADAQLRFGARYGQDEVDSYVKESWLDTIGSGLPYPQAITGLSVGVDYRHWFPGNQMYAIVSLGYGLSGYDQNLPDFRYGLAGYTSWKHDRWNADFYGELFYVALADDTFLDGRLRAGRIWKQYKDGSFLWGYWVGQFWVSGQVESPTENRMEFGPGIGYQLKEALSVTFELRGGYTFRSDLYSDGGRTYFNPTLIIAGGFYHGWP